MPVENRKSWRGAVQPERQSAELSLGGNPALRGQLVDVSAGGFAAQFPLTAELHPGMEGILRTCDGTHVVRIRHVRPHEALVSLGLERVRDLAPPRIPRRKAPRRRWFRFNAISFSTMLVEVACCVAFVLVAYGVLSVVGGALLKSSADPGKISFGNRRSWRSIFPTARGPSAHEPHETQAASTPPASLPEISPPKPERPRIRAQGDRAPELRNKPPDGREPIQPRPVEPRQPNLQGRVLTPRRELELAIRRYSEAARIDPGNVEAYLGQVSIWAQGPDRRLRDGRKALEAALRACELTDWKIPRCLEALAAAHAESGNFDEAVHWQEEAVRLLVAEEAPAEELEHARLLADRYRAGETFPESPEAIAS